MIVLALDPWSGLVKMGCPENGGLSSQKPSLLEAEVPGSADNHMITISMGAGCRHPSFLPDRYPGFKDVEVEVEVAAV